jgi:hypothetical protein
MANNIVSRSEFIEIDQTRQLAILAQKTDAAVAIV